MKKFLIISMVLLLVFLTACSDSKSVTDTPLPTPDSSAEGGVMSKFTAQSLEGEAVNESVLADHRLTMVNVWATFCSPCIQEMPDLGELAEEYEAKGVQIIGFVSDVLKSDGSVDSKQIDTAKDIVSSTHADYLHILPSPDLYGILNSAQSVPMTFFVDSTGKQVGLAYVGARSKAAWKTIIEEMLTEVEK